MGEGGDMSGLGAFDASDLGAFMESALGARGGGGIEAMDFTYAGSADLPSLNGCSCGDGDWSLGDRYCMTVLLPYSATPYKAYSFTKAGYAGTRENFKAATLLTGNTSAETQALPTCVDKYLDYNPGFFEHGYVDMGDCYVAKAIQGGTTLSIDIVLKTPGATMSWSSGETAKAT
jgi:hypothetical protein